MRIYKESYTKSVARMQRLCHVELRPESNKILVYIKSANHRITGYVNISFEYKFPTWNASEAQILKWFWEWVDADSLREQYRCANSELGSFKRFMETKHTLSQMTEEDETPVKSWSCKKCGSHEQPSGRLYAKVCTACKSESIKAAQKLRNEFREKEKKEKAEKQKIEKQEVENQEEIEVKPKQWKCNDCGSTKRPPGRHVDYCKHCKKAHMTKHLDFRVS